MWWFAVPAVLAVGKLIYDAATDDSSSSSDSDNSSEVERRERERLHQQRVAQGQRRQREQLTCQMQAELRSLTQQFLVSPVALSASAGLLASDFCSYQVADAQSAKDAVGLITDGSLILSTANTVEQTAALQVSLEDLAALERLLKKV